VTSISAQWYLSVSKSTISRSSTIGFLRAATHIEDRHMKTRLLIVLSLLAWSSFAAAQPATTAAPSPLPPTDDYSALGPFETVSEPNTGPDGTYTIVRPATLGEDGFLHAPVIFGPGIGGQVQ